MSQALHSSQTKQTLTAITLFVSLLAAAIVAVQTIPTIAVDKMLAHDIQAQATLWENRALNNLAEGKDVFETQIITRTDDEYLKHITLSSDIYRFSMFTKSGRVFWSTNTSDIGRVISGSFFEDVVATGNLYYMHETVRSSEVDDFSLHALNASETGLREIAEVFTPVIKDGEVLGAIEFFTDITDTRNTFIRRVQLALTAISAIVLALILAIMLIIRRSSVIAVNRMKAQSDTKHELLNKQLQMAREVKLLGELNEWLQSSRSLDELFEMVGKFMTHILPSCEGSVYVYSNSRDVLDGCASWNGGAHKDHIHPEACWGLRRGRTYSYGESEVDFKCEHIDCDDERAYFCFPILAHGETVGLMTLKATAETSIDEFNAGKKLSQMCAEQISMAIANVRMRDQLHDQSVRDPLTGLFNRRHLTETLRKLITRSVKDGSALSIVSIDVDHFKKFNDNHGHDAGDMVLRAVGSTMVQQCDGDEVACRQGGEEFMLVLPDVTKDEAFIRAEKLRKSVEEIVVRYGEKNLPKISISIGLAHFPDHGTLPQDLMRAADDALYEAKAQGRNQTIVANTCGGADALPIDTVDTADTFQTKNNGQEPKDPPIKFIAE